MLAFFKGWQRTTLFRIAYVAIIFCLLVLLLPAIDGGSHPMPRDCAAAQRFEMAVYLFEHENEPFASDILNEIISDYADTPAAQQAKEMQRRISRPGVLNPTEAKHRP